MVFINSSFYTPACCRMVIVPQLHCGLLLLKCGGLRLIVIIRGLSSIA